MEFFEAYLWVKNVYSNKAVSKQYFYNNTSDNINPGVQQYFGNVKQHNTCQSDKKILIMKKTK